MGASAGGDDGPLESQRFAGNLDRIGAREAALADIDIDTEAAKAGCGVVGTNSRAEPTHALHDGRKIDLHAGGNANSELSRVTHLGHDPRCPDQRLRWHAADVKAVPTHQFLFYQGDLRAQTSRSRRCHQPGRPRAENDEVITPAWLGVLPVRRMNVRHQGAIVFIERSDFGNRVDQ